MMLIAAYGGLPIDYRTTPGDAQLHRPGDRRRHPAGARPRQKRLHQLPAACSTGGGFRIVASADGNDQNAITTDSLGGFRRFIGGPNGGNNRHAPRRRIPAEPTPARATASARATSAPTAQNPDACYRWLSYVAQHVDVFGAMPARLSQINDPTMQASLGDNAGFYQQYAQLLSDPNTIVFPSASGGNASISDFLIQFWLNRAFDNYVLNDADLNAELSDAQTYATAFQQCVAALPPASTTSDAAAGSRGINTGVRDCATQARFERSPSLVPRRLIISM